MQRRQALATVVRAAHGLAIHGNDLIGNQLGDRRAPLAKAGRERLGIDQRKHSPKGIVRGETIGQFQKRAQPRLFRLGERLNRHPAIGSTERGGDGDDDDLDQLVPTLGRATRVFQRRKMTGHRSLYTQVAHC